MTERRKSKSFFDPHALVIFLALVGICSCANGPGVGSESHFVLCSPDAACPIGQCVSGYCQKDGQRVTRDQLAQYGGANAIPSNETDASDSGESITPEAGEKNATTVGLPRSCAYPTPECTGVPVGTVFTQTVEGNYSAETDDLVIDRWHITGDLVIRAAHVAVINSQIDGMVTNEYAPAAFGGPFEISDSTVGPASGCLLNVGVADQNYTAIRVHIRGHEDGFRAGGPDVTIRDSYVKNCILETSHGDGIQDYPFTRNLVFDHNTVDMCGAWTTDRSQSCLVPGANSAVFVSSDPSAGYGSTNVRITNNLLMGGGYSLYTRPLVVGAGGGTGTWVISHNRVVDGTWGFAPFETDGHCANVADWSDNTIVTMDTSYGITSTVRTAPCPE